MTSHFCLCIALRFKTYPIEHKDHARVATFCVHLAK